MVARGRTIGVLTLATAESQRVYGAADVELAEELARRAAIAVDNARLHREVTHRAQAAEALAFVGDGILLVDREGVVRLWNATAETITGLRADEVVGRLAREAIPSWPSLAELVTPADAPGQTPPGKVVMLATEERRAVAVRGRASGSTRAASFAFRDLTAERAVEKLKSDFVSTVSHELRTPLAGVYGAAMTLRRADVEFDEEQRRVLLDVISAEAGRLARIVEDILSAGQLDANTLTLSVEPCDAGDLAAEAVRGGADALRGRACDRPGGRAGRAGGGRPLAAAPGAREPDRQRRQVLGGRASRWHVTIASRNGSVRFAVSDRGLGIPPADAGARLRQVLPARPGARARRGRDRARPLHLPRARRSDGGPHLGRGRAGGGSTFVVELPAG